MKGNYKFTMTPSYSPFSIAEGTKVNPSGPVHQYTLPPDELEALRQRYNRPPTDRDGKPLGKPSRPPGPGGAA